MGGDEGVKGAWTGARGGLSRGWLSAPFPASPSGSQRSSAGYLQARLGPRTPTWPSQIPIPSLVGGAAEPPVPRITRLPGEATQPDGLSRLPHALCVALAVTRAVPPKGQLGQPKRNQGAGAGGRFGGKLDDTTRSQESPPGEPADLSAGQGAGPRGWRQGYFWSGSAHLLLQPNTSQEISRSKASTGGDRDAGPGGLV